MDAAARVPMHEDDDRILGSTRIQRWSYATAKALDEHLLLAHAAHGLRGVIVRYFNIYGPRMDPEGYGSVMATFLRQALAGDPLTVYGDGLQSRCFTYIDDCVDGTMLAMELQSAEGQVFNIGNATTETTIADLARKVIDASGGDFDDRLRELRATLRSRLRGHPPARPVRGSRHRMAWLDRARRTRRGTAANARSLGADRLPLTPTACASRLDRPRAHRACRARVERVLESVPNRSRCARW